MKHLIVFNLPEEQEELDLHLNASKFHSVLWEFEQILRRMTKYNTHPTEDRELNELESALVGCIREKFYELYNDEDITL